MNKTKLSGPVFPTEVWDPAGFPRQAEGMYLRDYFAAKAMQGFCANSANRDALPKEISKGAYLVADEMLKARDA